MWNIVNANTNYENIYCFIFGVFFPIHIHTGWLHEMKSERMKMGRIATASVCVCVCFCPLHI